MKKDKFNKILLIIYCLFIIMQPFLDATIYFVNDSISLSFLRPTIVGILFIMLLFNKNISKKIKLTSIIYLGIFIIYSIIHLIVVKDNFYSNSTGNLMSEARYLIMYFYYLLLMFVTYMMLKSNDKNKIIKTVVIAGLVISSLYFISIITETSLNTYGDSLIKHGFKGWSNSAHYVGHTLIMVLPITLVAVFEMKIFKSIFKYILVLINVVVPFYLVGTKSAAYGILLIMIFYGLLKIIRLILKDRQYKSTLFILVIILCLIVTLPYTFARANLNNQLSIYQEKNNKDIDFITNSIYDSNNTIDITHSQSNKNKIFKNFTFSKKMDLVLLKNKEIKSQFFDNRQIQLMINKDLRTLAKVDEKLFGYGFQNMPKNTWVETDAFIIYYCFGILGFILLIAVPFLLLLYYGIRDLKYIKKFDNVLYLLAFGVGLDFAILVFVGYILYFAQTVFYFVFIYNLLIIYLKKLELKTDVILKRKDEKQKKYLFMTNDMEVGGAEVGLVDVLNELSKNNHVDLVLLRKKGPLLSKISDEVQIYEILKKERPKIINSIIRAMYFSGGIFSRLVYCMTIKEKYDVEVAYLEGYPAVFISSSINKKSVKIGSIRVGLKNHKLTIEKFKYGRYLLKKAYKKMDYIYSVSDLSRLEFIEKFPEFTDKTSCIYTYFDIESIRRKSLDEPDYNFDNKKINLLAVGRFDYQKGYDQLIEAFKIIVKVNKDICLHFVGKHETEYGDKVKKLIKDYKLEEHVVLHGVKDNPYSYIRKCDALISSSHYEGFPRVVNEALCLKKLCVGTKVTGTKEALKNGKMGILIDDSVEGLVEGINLALSSNIYFKYEKEINKFDGNKESFFREFNQLCHKKKEMIIFLPKLSYGGMEHSLISLINSKLLNKNYNITLFVVYSVDKSILNLIPKEIKVKLLWKHEWNIVGKFVVSFKFILNYIHYFFKKYDISISYAHQHWILAKLTILSSPNNVCFIHSNIKNSRTPSELRKLLKNLKYEKFKKLIAVSDDARDTLAKLINREDIYSINNLINGLEILEQAKEKVDDFDFNQKKVTFINVGRHEEATKRLSRIIGAMVKLNKEKYDYQMLFIGDGEDTDLYYKLKKDKNLSNLHIIGKRKNPFKYYVHADALVISSVSEGYPVVFQEAKILRKPILTTDVSDAKKDIDKKFGIVVDNNDKSIYRAMKQFLDQGFKIKENFDYKKYNEKIERELLKAFGE